MRRSTVISLLLAAAVLVCASPVLAVNQALNFSGRLEQGAGAVSGPVTLTVSIYTDPTDFGALVWSETLDIIDRAYIIHDGMVLMDGAPSDVIGNEEVRRVYLGNQFRL